MTGTVQKFEGSYGFIRPDDGSKDVFVHQTGILCDGFRRLWPGQAVQFELGETERGPCAVNVEVVETEAA